MSDRAKAQNGLAMKWLISGVALVTLIFWAPLNDPFNAPKSWILSIFCSWLLVWVIFQTKTQINQPTLKFALLISGTYAIALSMSWLASDNKYISFFGDYQRRTGYLSYLGLLVVFLAAAYLIRMKSVESFKKTLVILGLLLGIYGLFQHFRLDLIDWNNPYNPVIATYGNPDFAAVGMAILLILNFGIALRYRENNILGVLATTNVALLFVDILFSKVLQGLLISLFGVLIILISLIHQKSKILANFTGISLIIFSTLSLLGMLDKGPFSNYFYKSSVVFRGDYWRAGWRMFSQHPYFGIGLDRYGAYFRQYRDPTQVLRRGSDLVSNAAHNVPLQLAATGGIFLLMSYLLFTFFIFYRGLVTIKRASGEQKTLSIIIFTAWLAYQAQSLISIDNLGIAVWGYLLGGAIVGISIFDSELTQQSYSSEILQPFISSLLAIIFFVISVYFYQAEIAMNTLHKTAFPTEKAQIEKYNKVALKPLNYFFTEPKFQAQIAVDLARAGEFNIAIKYLQKNVNTDKHDYEALNALSAIFEYQNDWNAATNVRQNIYRIDPYNAENLLLLARDKKKLGDFSGAKTIALKIFAFAPDSLEARKAKNEFSL